MTEIGWPDAALLMTMIICLAWVIVSERTQAAITRRHQMRLQSVERMSTAGTVPAAEASAALTAVRRAGPPDGSPGGRHF